MAGGPALLDDRLRVWLFLLARDVSFFRNTAQHYGRIGASVPPLVAVLLLGLDWMWWREHARSGRLRDKHKWLRAENGALPSHDIEAPTHASERSTSEDESRRLLLNVAASEAQASPCELVNGDSSSAATGHDGGRGSPLHRHTTEAGRSRCTALPGHALEVQLEAARNVSFDDLQIHTP